jgi:tetratricopeptide (TPR) repeat protein
MISTSSTAVKEVRQATADPRFNVGPPRLNPLAASAPIAITKHPTSVGIDWAVIDAPSNAVASDVSAQLITRARIQVQRYPNSARSHTNLGIALLNSGNLADAREEFERALRIDPKQFVAASSLARIKVELNDFEGAQAIYHSLHRLYPGNPTAVLSLAQIAMRQERYEESEALFREAIRLGHRGITARYHLAMVLLRLRRTREAIAELRSAIRTETRAPFLYQGLGIAFVVSGDMKRAVTAFKTALSLSPNSQSVIQNLARAYVDSGEPDHAVAVLSDHLERSPDDVQLRELLAQAYHAKRLFKSAIAQWITVAGHLERAPSVDVDRLGRVLNNIGAAYLNDGDLRQAEVALQRSIAVAPGCGPIAYDNLARVYLRKDDVKGAATILAEARRRFPDATEPLELQTHIYLRSELYEEAINLLAPIVANGKGTIQAYADLGWLLTEIRRDNDEAIRILREGQDKFKGRRILINNFAYTLLMAGRVREAREVLDANRALLRPNDQDAESLVVLTATWGLLHLREGDLAMGEQFYQHAHEMAINLNNQELAESVNQKMHLELARELMNKGDVVGAHQHLRAGLGIRHGRPFVRTDLLRLAKQLNA